MLVHRELQKSWALNFWAAACMFSCSIWREHVSRITLIRVAIFWSATFAGSMKANSINTELAVSLVR